MIWEGGGGVNEVDKRAEPRGKTGSREPGSVSESRHDLLCLSRCSGAAITHVLAAGPPAPPPGTERKEDGGVAQIQKCSVKTSLHPPRHVTLSGCRKVNTSFFHQLIARATGGKLNILKS